MVSSYIPFNGLLLHYFISHVCFCGFLLTLELSNFFLIDVM